MFISETLPLTVEWNLPMYIQYTCTQLEGLVIYTRLRSLAVEIAQVYITGKVSTVTMPL